MSTPIAIAKQGDSRYEVDQQSQNIFTNEFALTPNDSTAAPTPVDLTLNGKFIRIRSNGDLVTYNGTDWIVINKDNIITDANAYTDTQDVQVLSNAEVFATNADTTVLNSANTYTNSQVSTKINITDAVDKTSVQTITGVKNLPNGFQINGGFTPPYKSFSYIAPAVQNNPTLNVQGQYIQLRMSGDLGAFVNDAAASEIRLSGVTNTGTGQSAQENSVVISGGVNNINLVCGTLSNVHTENSPTGSCTTTWVNAATQVPTQAGFTYGTIVSGYFASQIAGTNNYTLYADGGNSVIPTIVPKDVTTAGLIVKGLPSQSAALFAITNSSGSTGLNMQANLTGGMGGLIAGSNFWVNNNTTSASTVNLTLKAIISQTAPYLNLTTSTNAVVGFIAADGGIKSGGTTRDASAIADIESTTKGLLIPRMSTTQKNAISSPATGLTVTDTTLNRNQYYDGTSWQTVPIKIEVTTTIDFGSIAANSQLDAPSPITFAGAAIGDQIFVTPVTDISGLMFKGKCTTAGQVIPIGINFTTSAIDPTSQSFKISIIK